VTLMDFASSLRRAVPVYMAVAIDTIQLVNHNAAYYGQLVIQESDNGQDQRSGCYTFNVTNTQILSATSPVELTEPRAGDLAHVSPMRQCRRAGSAGGNLIVSPDCLRRLADSRSAAERCRRNVESRLAGLTSMWS
jgi:hypothetical protein